MMRVHGAIRIGQSDTRDLNIVALICASDCDKDSFGMVTRLNRVIFLGPFRKATGTGTIEVPMSDNETVQDLLTKLIDRFGQQFKKALFDETSQLRQDLVIRLDGENIAAKEGLGTQIRAGQELMIMPALSGG